MPRQRLNPHTVERLGRAFSHQAPMVGTGTPHPRADRATHILDICASARHPLTGKPMWPGAIYRARDLGYLVQRSPGMYVPTLRFWTEYMQVKEIRRRQDLDAEHARTA